MLGILLWTTGAGKQNQAEMVQVLRVPFYCVRIDRREHTPERILRRRIRRAVGRLRRLGVREVVLPGEFAWRALVEGGGLRPVSTVPLQRALAAELLEQALERQGITGACVRVAVWTEELTAEAVRAVTALCIRYRYVLLETPGGGEALADRLRRNFGVSLQLHPEPEAAERAEAMLLFSPAKTWRGKAAVTVNLFEEGGLPSIVLPPTQEAQLMPEAERGALLSALYTAGALRREWLTLRSGESEKTEGGSAEFAGKFPFSPGQSP